MTNPYMQHQTEASVEAQRRFAVRTLVRMAGQRCDASEADARNAESMALASMEEGCSAAMAVASAGKWLRALRPAVH